MCVMAIFTEREFNVNVKGQFKHLCLHVYWWWQCRTTGSNLSKWFIILLLYFLPNQSKLNFLLPTFFPLSTIDNFMKKEIGHITMTLNSPSHKITQKVTDGALVFAQNLFSFLPKSINSSPILPNLSIRWRLVAVLCYFWDRIEKWGRETCMCEDWWFRTSL